MGYTSTTSSQDTYCEQIAPDRNFATHAEIRIKSGVLLGYLSFDRPFRLGSTITRAEVVLRTAAAFPAQSRTVTLKRQGKRTVGWQQLTWNNRPGTQTDGASVAKTGALARGDEWIFDVTSHVQRWSDGAAWYGWEISTTSATIIRFLSEQTTQAWAVDLQPELRVWYSDAPDQPDELIPSGGRVISTAKPVVRWATNDVNGNTEIVAAQVQTSTTGSFSPPSWDSGSQPIDSASLDLANLENAVTFPGFTSGVETLWRVRVKDGAGLWSPWAVAVATTYRAPGTLTLVSPSPATGTVSDPTPVVAWQLAGATQRAYRVEVSRRNVGTLDSWTPVWDSGKITSTAQTITLPKTALRYDDRTYRLYLTVWDTQDRVAVPGAAAAYQRAVTFAFDDDAATPGVTTLSVTQDGTWPWALVRWTTATVPDRTLIIRSGRILAILDPVELADLRQPDGSYLWRDRATPGKPGTWAVKQSSNSKISRSNPTVTFNPLVRGRWLITDDFPIFIAGTEQEMTWEEVATTHTPVGGVPVRIVETMNGPTVQVTGSLIRTQTGTSLDNTSSALWRNRLLRVKAKLTPATFLVADMALEVTVSDVTVSPEPIARDAKGDHVWACTFTVTEAGPHDWAMYE